MKVEKDKIKDIQVLETIKEGKRVWREEDRVKNPRVSLERMKRGGICIIPV